MPRLPLFDAHGKQVGEVDLDDAVFGVTVREHLFYEVVKMQLANRRSGTACTKDRSQVAYSTRKLFRQKGTGRARRGSRKSPILRGGGTIFGPKPRSYAYKVPRKVRKEALRAALSRRVEENRLLVVQDFGLSRPRTRELVRILDALRADSALVVDVRSAPGADALRLSARNLTRAKYLAPEGVNVYDVLHFPYAVFTERAARAVEGALKP